MYLAGKHTDIELNSSRIKILSIKGKIEASKYSFRNCRNAFFFKYCLSCSPWKPYRFNFMIVSMFINPACIRKFGRYQRGIQYT